MPDLSIQDLCDLGQQELMQMNYLQAEAALVRAESLALAADDFETLSRLYMPLQETRRQRRQRCGEGIVRLDLIAENPGDKMEARHVIDNYSHGQLLVAGWGSIEPALQVRELAIKHELYVETFLAAAYPIGAGRAVAIVPLGSGKMPDASPRSIDELIRLLPPHSIVLNETQLSAGEQRGSTKTFAHVMSIWEQLHGPFLAQANATTLSKAKLDAYRRTIEVDYACELAHQNLSAAASAMLKKPAN
jgi:hypothetical protein